MDFAKLKTAVIVTMISSHILIFTLLFILYISGGFAFDEFTTSVAILMPLFAGFTTLIVKDAIAAAAPGAVVTETRPLPWNFAFVTLAFCGSFTVYLLVMVTLKGFNVGFSTFDQYKTLLGVSETVFGVYVGYLMPTLFAHGGPLPARTSPGIRAASRSEKTASAAKKLPE
jgi:hypothetical protein